MALNIESAGDQREAPQGGGDVFGAALNIAYDAVMQGYWQRQQEKQQTKFTRQQIEANKELGAYNQGLALDMWEKTNYAAQAEQMRKAGLNVGLMYKGAGQGGTTQGGSAGNSVTSGMAAAPQPGRGMEIAMQAQMMQAQIKLAESQANKNNVEAAKTAGVDTQLATAGLQKIIAETTNEGQKNTLMKLDERLKQLDVNTQTQTWNETVAQAQEATEQAVQETIRMARENKEGYATMEARIQQIKTGVNEQLLRMGAMKANITNTNMNTAETNQSIMKMAAEITRMEEQTYQGKWGLQISEDELKVHQQELVRKLVETEFKTSTPEQIKQWTGIITDILGSTRIKMK